MPCPAWHTFHKSASAHHTGYLSEQIFFKKDSKLAQTLVLLSRQLWQPFLDRTMLVFFGLWGAGLYMVIGPDEKSYLFFFAQYADERCVSCACLIRATRSIRLSNSRVELNLIQETYAESSPGRWCLRLRVSLVRLCSLAAGLLNCCSPRCEVFNIPKFKRYNE